MSHFETSIWMDFLRDLAAPEVRRELERHLESGCSDCREVLSSLEVMMRALDPQSEESLPEAAVRSVKGIFGLERGVHDRRLKPVPLELVFDSASEPPIEGTRAGASDARQFLYESRDYALDLRLDRSPETRETLILGQLLRRPGEPCVDVPAYLTADGSVVAASVTGEFGAFCLEAGVAPPLELWLFPDATHRIAVEIDDPYSSAATSSP